MVDSSCEPEFNGVKGKALNTPYVSKAVEKEWGVIKHPTIEELALMVLSQADRQGWDNIVLWKMVCYFCLRRVRNLWRLN